MRKSCLIFFVALATPASSSLHAQDRLPNAFGVNVGVSQFDLSGTGTTPVVSFRLERELNRLAVIEGALTLLRPDEQSSETRTYFVPEVQLQLQYPGVSLRPYAGAGVGAFFGSGNSTTEVSLSASGGLRFALTSAWDLRAELRVRGIGTGFEGSSAEWTAGFAYRY